MSSAPKTLPWPTPWAQPSPRFGEVDRIFALEGTTRDQCLSAAETEARETAIAAGARADTLTVIEREDVPLAYLPGNATRIHLKVVGDMGDLNV